MARHLHTVLDSVTVDASELLVESDYQGRFSLKDLAPARPVAMLTQPDP